MPSRILVVEDDSFIRALIVDQLETAGFEVDQAGSSDAAVRLLDADGYKAMVTDMQLRGSLNGVDLAKHSQNKSDIPVVFVHGRPEVVQRLKSAGIRSAALPQPFAVDQLVEIVRSLTGAPRPTP